MQQYIKDNRIIIKMLIDTVKYQIGQSENKDYKDSTLHLEMQLEFLEYLYKNS